MRCCVGSVEYTSNPGNMFWITHNIYGSHRATGARSYRSYRSGIYLPCLADHVMNCSGNRSYRSYRSYRSSVGGVKQCVQKKRREGVLHTLTTPVKTLHLSCAHRTLLRRKMGGGRAEGGYSLSCMAVVVRS